MSLIDRYPPLALADSDDIGSNPTDSRPVHELIAARLSRRGLLRGLGAGAATALAGGLAPGRARGAESPSTLTFAEIAHGIDETHHVAKGYAADLLIRWGDPLAADAAAFDPADLRAADQAKQFGYNCDFIAFMPLPRGSDGSAHGLLCVNHEYTSAELMWPGLTEENKTEVISKAQVEYEMAAHGHSILEIRRTGGKWRVVEDSPYNRRLSALDTPMRIAGPAAGHARLKTSADPTGTRVIGTLNNCAGGWTPWGTVLIAEENFNGYFGGDAESMPQAAAYKRYGISAKSWYGWWRHQDRFNVEKEPNEPNRFGWVVEFDPYDPRSVPVKRTALGRFKHEGAHSILNRDGRVVVYMGDDERFDYLYRFVSAGRYDPADPAANADLLDEGTLSVARLFEDGRLEWLPLVHGEGPLTAANGFDSQAEVLIEVRRAADLLEATPMDRPEDVEPNPVTGRVYAILTNNSRRRIDQIDAVNPRFDNRAGHILELIPPGDGAEADHAAAEFRWEPFIVAGNPVWGSTLYGKGIGASGWFACPDNCAFDPRGRIWIATDQGDAQGRFGIGDGVWAADTAGDGRAVTRFFYRGPVGAEICGPAFTPDGRTLFLAIQHPGEQAGSTFDAPATRWPDFAEGMPPRPAVVAITRDDGGEIGS